MDELSPVEAGGQAHGPQQRKSGGCRGWGFPWWMLWLIWPAAGMFKWLGAAAADTFGEATAQLNAVLLPFVALWPLLLVAALILLHRRLVKR